MIKGITLTDLAKKVEFNNNHARDFMVSSSAMRMEDDLTFSMESAPSDRFGSAGIQFSGNENFHNQVAGKLSIPVRYYNRLKEDAPDLLQENVNRWLDQEPATRMVRTLDNGSTIGRAYLSEHYRPLDNVDLINQTLPVLEKNGLKIQSCDITDKKLYIQAISEKRTEEVVKGDPVQSGIIITNSETGHGALDIRTLIFRLVCTNGMVSASENDRWRKIHVKKAEGMIANQATVHMKSETLEAMDKAFWLQTRDAVEASVEASNFDTYLAQMKKAAAVTMEDPEKTLEEIGRKHSITQDERKTVLSHLIDGGDLSMWGAINAVTRSAQDSQSYDRAVELETIGGKILTTM